MKEFSLPHISHFLDPGQYVDGYPDAHDLYGHHGCQYGDPGDLVVHEPVVQVVLTGFRLHPLGASRAGLLLNSAGIVQCNTGPATRSTASCDKEGGGIWAYGGNG